jgi:hypothetical protein
MATVTITIIDDEDGGAKFRIESDPPFDGPAVENPKFTAAQGLGLSILEFVGGEIVDVEGEE